MTFRDDVKDTIKVCFGFILVTMGIIIILADVRIAFGNKESAHIVNQIIGVGLLLFGGIIISPGEITTALKTLGGVVLPYLPKHHDDP